MGGGFEQSGWLFGVLGDFIYFAIISFVLGAISFILGLFLGSLKDPNLAIRLFSDC